jgi:hypothetical protein
MPRKLNPAPDRLTEYFAITAACSAVSWDSGARARRLLPQAAVQLTYAHAPAHGIDYLAIAGVDRGMADGRESHHPYARREDGWLRAKKNVPGFQEFGRYHRRRRDGAGLKAQHRRCRLGVSCARTDGKLGSAALQEYQHCYDGHQTRGCGFHYAASPFLGRCGVPSRRRASSLSHCNNARNSEASCAKGSTRPAFHVMRDMH